MTGHLTRRAFARNAAARAALLGVGELAWLKWVPPVSAAEAKLDPKLVRLDSGIEPLVCLLEETPRDKLLEEVAARIKKGLSYREVLTALFLAGVRNIFPVGVNNFHAVLVIHAAHQASLAAPDSDRWLPIFWSLDSFKKAQLVNKQSAGGWRMGPVDESKVLPARKARRAFLQAVGKRDQDAAELAVASLVRSSATANLFDAFALQGARNFSGVLGHPAIFVGHAWRALQCIGEQHAEPVLRSLTRVVVGAWGSPPDDLLWKENRERAARIPAGWQEGKSRAEATTDLLAVMREASPAATSEKVVELLKGGISPQSIWDAAFVGTGELLMRQPARPDNWLGGVIPLHAATSLNALRYAYGACVQEDTCKFLLLQAAAIVPRFLETMKRRGRVMEGRIDKLEPAPVKDASEIFAAVSSDRTLAARKALSYVKNPASAKDLFHGARLLAFLKGTDAHDYKFTSATFEDYAHVSPGWRDRTLASGMYIFRGSADKDNGLVSRTRAALKT